MKAFPVSPRPLSRRRVLAAAGPLAALAATVPRGAARASRAQDGRVIRAEPEPTSAACPRLVVPAYFDPDTYWDAAIAAAPTVEYIILNPNSGPGVGPDPAFQGKVQRAQAAGIKVLGYVFTDLARRPLDELKEEIRAYEIWYGVDGIHLDGAQDDPEYLPYYRKLAAAIRASGPGDREGIVWLNPGYVPSEGFMEIVDIVETFEWFYEKYPDQEFPGWIYNYPPERFSHIVYNVPNDEAALAETLALARSRNVGYVYITDLHQPTEYASLPSFWTAKLDQLCSLDLQQE